MFFGKNKIVQVFAGLVLTTTWIRTTFFEGGGQFLANGVFTVSERKLKMTITLSALALFKVS